MSDIYNAAKINGKVCGVVIIRCAGSLFPKGKCELVKILHRAFKHGLKRKVSSFLVPLTNESDILSVRYLFRLRRSNPRLSVYVVVPSDESILPCKASQRKAIEGLEEKADGVFHSEVPISDFGLNVAMFCDHLIVCSIKAEALLDEYLDDLRHIHTVCSVEVLKR